MSQRTILIAGGYPHHLPLEVEKAFQRAGWETRFFDLSPESPWYRPVIKPVRKLIHNLRIQKHRELFEDTRFGNLGWRSARWLEEVRAMHPDAVLHLRGNRLGTKSLSEAAKVCPLFCWMIEGFERLPRLGEEAPFYRKFLVYAENYVAVLAEKGIPSEFYPHHAAETPPEARVRNQDRRLDWAFLGSHSPWREKCLEAVLKQSPNGFVLGKLWDRVARRNPRFRSVVHEGYYGRQEAFDLYLDARAGLDILPREAPTRNGVTMRFTELLACGCQVFSQPIEEIQRLPWKMGARLTPFATPEELAARLAAFLCQPPAPAADGVLDLSRAVSGYEGLVSRVEAGLRSPGYDGSNDAG